MFLPGETIIVLVDGTGRKATYLGTAKDDSLESVQLEDTGELLEVEPNQLHTQAEWEGMNPDEIL